MGTTPDRRHERWANLRHSIVGALLAAPPHRGELRAAIEALTAKTWQHPITSEPVSFAYSTLERWRYLARRAGHADNMVALAELDAALGHVPSYTTVRRLMKERGLFRQKRRRNSGREGDDR